MVFSDNYKLYMYILLHYYGFSQIIAAFTDFSSDN